MRDAVTAGPESPSELAVGCTGLGGTPRVGCKQNQIYLLSVLDFVQVLSHVLLYVLVLPIVEHPGSCPLHWGQRGRVHW